jgi:DNA-binding NarL/FixJ family response regulator
LAKSLIRVLLVENFEPFRRHVVSMLQSRPDLEVVGEAWDGLEAVQMAQEVKPDLVLLDIGLPGLNGMEVARQISRLCAESKILFVSQETSSDIVHSALAIGAKGYVVKTHAGTELLIAINAVLRGERFVSSGLTGIDFTEGKGQHTSAHPNREKAVAPFSPQNSARRHEVAFYHNDAALVDGFANLSKAALAAENAVIVIATTEHQRSILQRLRTNSVVDVDGALRDGSLTQLDALAVVSAVMVKDLDLPDPVRCARLIGEMVTRALGAARGAQPRVVICGECAPALLREGNADAAIRLEHLWDEITRGYQVDTLCGYLWTAFPQKESSPTYSRICVEHSAIVGRELGQ